MLNVPTPFPQVGSYALRERFGQLHLVRIQQRNPASGAVLISYPDLYGASGSETVPLADLMDGTPLNEAERSEYAALFSKMLATKRPRRADKDRYTSLRTREIHADALTDKLRRAGLLRMAA